MTEAKVQHYVPKFLLRNFGTGKKDKVWVFDKLLRKSFETNAKNIASESRFYDFEVEGTALSLESSLSNIESKAKPVIEKMLNSDSTAGLTHEERSVMAAFLAIQFVRTKAFRMQWADFPRLLRDKFERLNEQITPDSQAEKLIADPSKNDIKIETTRMLLGAPDTYGTHFLGKTWFLGATTSNEPFWISDNPISLQNATDMGPFGNLGLAVKGIEIYLPLSSTRALAMWCPSLREKIGKAAQTLRSPIGGSIAKTLKNPAGILAMDEALSNGGVLPYNSDHVMNFNALQVGRSERYVISPQNDFSLARRMIDDHPHLKRGQRLEDATAQA
ncbi:MAG: DUF4238 domain-containing protein [Pseudomonadota bacterium]